MLFLVVKAVALMCVVFGVMSWLGMVLAGPKRRTLRPHYSAFNLEAAEVLSFPQVGLVDESKSAASLTVPKPVAYLDAAAEHFTAGVIAPPKGAELVIDSDKTVWSDKPSYAPPQASPRLEGLPSNVVIQLARGVSASEIPLKRASSLASMTPESVEAAVQQAGSGLEPVRLSAPQGPLDDLTLISGISVNHQAALNDMGIFHFWQVAGWSPENVAWVAKRTESQRIARENWMSQACKLAKLS